jgi:hypothetical protein
MTSILITLLVWYLIGAIAALETLLHEPTRYMSVNGAVWVCVLIDMTAWPFVVLVRVTE